MSPKPAKRLISLKHCGLGLAGHYRWEKEVLVDYIATRLGFLREDIQDDAKYDGITHESHYFEMLAIAKALRKHPGAGMGAKVELSGVFLDLRDFVEWSKEELADYLIHQIINCDLTSVYANNAANRRFADEVHTLAIAIYQECDFDGCEDADAAAQFLKRAQAMRRENEIAAAEAAEAAAATADKAGAATPKAARPARTRAAA